MEQIQKNEEKNVETVDQTPKDEFEYVFHLEKAIEDGEFEIFFQPIIHTISGSLCGFEALVRWNHPEFGFLNPFSFIPAMEETQQIYHLDLHVVELVCKWYARERELGRPVVPVSVNLSRMDFISVDVFGAIDGLAKQYGMPPEMLNVEITESVFGDESYEIADVIKKFRSAGYQVWMDDFGSGYSSLNTLKDFEVDELKIDMEFLSDMSARSKRIITSIIFMAKELKLVTLCEGVETEEQVEFLRTIGCDRMQGFYFARPMRYGEVLETLEKKQIRFESEEDRRYYHEINRINLLSPSPFIKPGEGKERHGGGIPLAILEKNKNRYGFIYKNEEFTDLLKIIGAEDAFEGFRKLVYFGYLTVDEVSGFLNDVMEKGEKELVFSANGDLCKAKGKLLSSEEDRCAILLSIDNITQNMNITHEQLMNQSLLSIYSMFLRVSLLRPEKNELVTVFSRDHYGIATDVAHDLRDLITKYAEKYVTEEDREKYLSFMEPSTLEERIRESDRGFINTKIKTEDEDGTYSRKMYLAVATGNHEVLVLVRYANL